MKYIDAKKLIAEIKAWRNKQMGFAWDAVNEVLKIVSSIQQEQPEVDLVAELKHHLATTPKEQLEKEWKELELWGNIGPTVQEFLYGKQPEVDIATEYDEQFYSDPVYGKLVNRNAGMAVARHFYELGLKAKEEKMKAPDKIWVREFAEGVNQMWSHIKATKTSAIAQHEYIRKDALLKYFHQRVEELGSPLNGVFGSTERDNCNERISELLLLIDKLNEM